MLLLHQTGTVKIGEVVRYTITYTPAHDRILPAPHHLYLKVKNTSIIALRAAFIHGPYTLYVASSPSTFQPNKKVENPHRDGVPDFEPNLKAGASWQSQLFVPESVRKSAGSARSHLQQQTTEDESAKSVTWIVEVASQVIFSNSAAVHYEILLGRDEKSLSLGFGGLSGGANSVPGQVSDHQQSHGAKDGSHNAQAKGVFSRAIKLKVDDTASLWNNPKLPEWDDQGKDRPRSANTPEDTPASVNKKDVDEHRNKRQKKVHLVVVTHGLHSNLGADMLYMKESIDAAAQQAKADSKVRRAKRREEEKQRASNAGCSHGDHHEDERENEAGEKKAPAEQKEDNTDESEDDEQVIVRGFSGNAVRTEKGIKYLGKRLAKYVLAMTYPDQPFKPIQRSTTQSLAEAIKHDSSADHGSGKPVHSHSTILKQPYKEKKLAYKITSISFIAHSLGGLIQTYAVAYIQKHSPHFFDLIKPINFIALATPFLGLSNENPLYVKFALDFGLVGRTGQDLGLTWRAPTIARSGWGAIVSGIGDSAHKKAERQHDPGTKPLLRILPTGPAHTALKKFRNRTVYSNVVNDGIVPLRTSCLLFLDWEGLGRVEKARRENGLVGTMASWGWAELTGANRASPKRPWFDGQQESENGDGIDDTETNTPMRQGKGNEVPQPSANEANEADDDARSLKVAPRRIHSVGDDGAMSDQTSSAADTADHGGALESIMAFFRPNSSSKTHEHAPKQSKIYRRSQVVTFDGGNTQRDGNGKGASKASTGVSNSENAENHSAPPRTNFFESAADLLNPPLPPIEFIIDPSSRPRTIFHDRVYHPEDIPPPPLKRESTSAMKHRLSMHMSSPPLLHRQSSSKDSHASAGTIENAREEVIDGSAMKVEEKIARAYHRDLSWRKVLVRLEPDAHNNMIVRRKFANAYGWPVVKHLVDTHFSDSAVANMRDEDEGTQERAKDSNEKPTKSGDEIKQSERGPRNKHDAGNDQDDPPHLNHTGRTNSETLESTDRVPVLNSLHPGNLAQALHSSKRPSLRDREDSAQWSEGDFMDSDGDSDAETPHHSHSKSASTGGAWNWTEAIAGKGAVSPRAERGTSRGEIDDFLRGGKRVDGAHGHGHAEGADGTAEPVVGSEGYDGMVGLGRPLSGKSATSSGVAEEVARLSLGKDHHE
jgi:hypothetical protein